MGKKTRAVAVPLVVGTPTISSVDSIPPIVRGSKYPWEKTANAVTEDDPIQTFFIPTETADRAKTARTSLQTSGRNYYDARGGHFTVVCRVALEGPHGIHSYVTAATS